MSSVNSLENVPSTTIKLFTQKPTLSYSRSHLHIIQTGNLPWKANFYFLLREIVPKSRYVLLNSWKLGSSLLPWTLNERKMLPVGMRDDKSTMKYGVFHPYCSFSWRLFHKFLLCIARTLFGETKANWDLVTDKLLWFWDERDFLTHFYY